MLMLRIFYMCYMYNIILPTVKFEIWNYKLYQ